MKTKVQKAEEIKKAEELLSGSKFLAFAEFGGVPAEEVRKLRIKAKEMGANVMMLKKRLLNVALKNKGIDYDIRQFKASVGTIFSSDVEKGSGAIYGFFSNLGESKEEKAENIKKILGGFDITNGASLDASKVIAIGQLPPRDVLMAQFMGMLVAPLRTFMYILQEKAKMMGSTDSTSSPQANSPQGGVPAAEEKTEAPVAEAPSEEPKAETHSQDSVQAEPAPSETPAENSEPTNTETSAESNETASKKVAAVANNYKNKWQTKSITIYFPRSNP